MPVSFCTLLPLGCDAVAKMLRHLLDTFDVSASSTIFTGFVLALFLFETRRGQGSTDKNQQGYSEGRPKRFWFPFLSLLMYVCCSSHCHSLSSLLTVPSSSSFFLLSAFSNFFFSLRFLFLFFRCARLSLSLFFLILIEKGEDEIAKHDEMSLLQNNQNAQQKHMV